MTISLVTLLAPPGKVVKLPHSTTLKPETCLTDDRLTPTFGDLLAPQHHVIKSLARSKAEPKPETLDIDSQERSEPAQATTLLNLVSAMLPTAPQSQSPLSSSPSTLSESDIEPSTSPGVTHSAAHAGPALAAKKGMLNATLDPHSAQQALETRQPLTPTVPTALAAATAPLLPHSVMTVQTSVNDSRTPHAFTASLPLTQSPSFPELALQPASAQELKAPLGSLQWQRDLSQQIIFHKPGQHTIHLKLHPEELGDVKISMTVNKDHAELVMLSNHGQVRSALEAALPQLRQALADNGIQLGNSQVGHDAASGQQSAFSSYQPPEPPSVTLTQGEVHEPSSAAETAPALLRDGSQISLLV